jgi:outer membrane receptor protein involved in Fe transport
LNLHFWDFVNWNINVDYTDERPREPAEAPTLAAMGLPPRPDVSSETVWDTTIRLEDLKGFDVYFSVHNIFDEDRVSPTPLQNYPLDDTPEAGTEYTFGVTYRF